MADNSIKVPENVAGKFYVDQTCNMCDVCMVEAPTLLKYNEDKTYVYFAKQPSGPEEEAAAPRALEVCPTQSIGNDG